MVLDKMKDILVEQLECNPEDITMAVSYTHLTLPTT